MRQLACTVVQGGVDRLSLGLEMVAARVAFATATPAARHQRIELRTVPSAANRFQMPVGTACMEVRTWFRPIGP
jgi:hypothetical protein